MVKKIYLVYIEKTYKYYYDEKGNKVFLNGDEQLCIIYGKYYVVKTYNII